MADRSVTLSRVLVQSHDLAAVHAWAALKAACGHSRPFFGDGPASLPVGPVAPICPVLAGSVGVAL
jgi:hypothetical protein